jgi:hypothetical protein
MPVHNAGAGVAKALMDSGRATVVARKLLLLSEQEKIRIDIVLRDNLP